MPRRPAPWFREQTQSWYVKIAGVQHPLGPDKAEAYKKYHRLMAGEGLVSRPKDLTFPELVEQFLENTQVAPRTRDWYREFLEDFTGRNPRLKPNEVAPRHVQRWLKAERKKAWGQSTQRSAITILKLCLNWAVREKLLGANPITDLERPAAVRRERVLSGEERLRILTWYPEGDPFRDLLVAMMESGCRPGEAAKVEAKHVNLEEGTWTLPGKTTRATGRMRVVFLTPTLLALTRQLMERHPTGPIFRNADGNAWTPQAINCRFRRKRNRKKDPLAKDVTAYTYRATWATDALENEVSDAAVAVLMGHSDTTMVHKHYSVLHERRKHLREAAEKAVRPKPSGDGS